MKNKRKIFVNERFFRTKKWDLMLETVAHIEFFQPNVSFIDLSLRHLTIQSKNKVVLKREYF